MACRELEGLKIERGEISGITKESAGGREERKGGGGFYPCWVV